MDRVSCPLAAAVGVATKGSNRMKSEELRALQSPLKQQYRDAPETARVSARAEGSLDPNDVAIVVDSWAGKVVAGLHAAVGGDGEQACSADVMLQAVVGCAGVTLRAVATAMGVTIHSGRVIAEGTWDARGTLGVDRTVPVGLTEIRLRFEVDCDADRAKLEKMIQTTERACVVLQTLKSPPTIDVSLA